MSPRRNRRRADAARERAESRATAETIESWPDGQWVVRQVPGAANGTPGAAAGNGKYYRCPGCDQEIPSTTAHLVCWPVDGGGVAERRHWHRACWRARERRAPRLPRPRGAPRL
ncbi:MAG: ATP/GTP-binding protein [Micromonosporaceae bacterium]|nr:ATP/GTP-binding protein [Micromonosporaceae bacterium]